MRCCDLDVKLNSTISPYFSRTVLLLVPILGLLDYLSGPDLAFSFFYLIPVSLAAWYGKGYQCYLVAALAAATGQFANDMAGEPHHHYLVSLWNDLVQLLFFSAVALLLHRIKERLIRAKRLSQQDFLTGLINKRQLIYRLTSEVARASRSREPLVVGFIDLDHFKRVNDELGHSEGDRLLFLISQVMEKALRRSDILARVGGDEFVMVLANCRGKDAEVVAVKVLELISTLAVENDWPISASIGLLHLEQPRAYEDVGVILDAADELMYEVKAEGRNSFKMRTWS